MSDIRGSGNACILQPVALCTARQTTTLMLPRMTMLCAMYLEILGQANVALNFFRLSTSACTPLL